MALPIIAGYTLIEPLGTGGFASVYLATRDDDGQRVAIKVLHAHTSNENDLRRFEREARTMRAFDGHPHIVRVFDSGETADEARYTVLEFVEGGSARDILKDQGALPWTDVTRIAVQICSALDIAHRSGVLHRDIKPANVLLDEDLAKLGDFGIARLAGQSQVTAAQSIIGTLAYTPPEMFHNSAFDGRGDIYQLGVTMYEMLLGRAPFSSAAADNKAAIIRRIIEKPAPPLAPFDIPQPLSDLLDEVLAKDPADRPQSAERLGQRLNDIEQQLGRVPTPMYRAHADLPSTSVEPEGAPTMPIDLGATPTIDATGVGVFDNAAPTPPIVSPPTDVDLTVAEPRPEVATSLIAKPPEATIPEADTSPPPSTTDFASEPVEEPERGGRPWILLLLTLIVVLGIGAVAAFTQLNQGEGTAGNDSAIEGDGGDTDGGGDPLATEFVAVDSDVFAQPDGASGVIFNSVANSAGLTMVGSAGASESVADQRSIVWTLGADGFALQRDLDASGAHRMWDIGVNQETFLVVGDTVGPDGVAWTGGQASNFSQVTSPDFTGPAADGLRASVIDPTQNSTFLVGGSRSEGSTPTATIWEVTNEPSWAQPTWTQVDIGNPSPGVINDIAVDDQNAVAVGVETVGGVRTGLVLIRRDDTWSPLIGPLENVEFWSVALSGDDVIIVGEQNIDSDPTPIAVVADRSGEGSVHSLPIRDEDAGGDDVTGIARSVRVLNDGTVVAVGDVGGENNPDTDRRGAIWEYLPDNGAWTTRASPDLLRGGFAELWTINEFDGEVYIFGRTESEDGRRTAGGWTFLVDE